MTPEEALEIINIAIAEVEWNYPIEYAAAFELVKNALENKIPKFVKCPKGWQGIRYTRYYCPACGELTRKNERVCHTCGQKLKYPTLKRNDSNALEFDWNEETI